MGKNNYDLIIIGAGPAGVSAGVYASRKQLRTLLLTDQWGGQSVVSPDIENWIGTVRLSGQEFADALKHHLEAYANDIVSIKDNVQVVSVGKKNGQFNVQLASGEQYQSNAVLVASGSKRRTLSVPGAQEFSQKGLTYCASCDGPLFSGQDVAVIGGGNAGFESAAQLLAYAKSVTLLQHSAEYKADPVTVEKVLAHPNMTGILNAEPTRVEGVQFVTGLAYNDIATNTEHLLQVTGIFVEIGMVPNTDFVADVVERDTYHRITIDPWSQKTSTAGIWAAGDCTNIKYHQNNISAGDAVRALEDIYVELHTK